MSKCRTHHGPNKGKVSKQKYPSRVAAEKAIVILYKDKPNINHRLEAYKCSRCGCWHFGRLTSKAKGLPMYDSYTREKHFENLVGMLIGVIRGTYPGYPRTKRRS